jgi:hypothetical protein
MSKKEINEEEIDNLENEEFLEDDNIEIFEIDENVVEEITEGESKENESKEDDFEAVFKSTANKHKLEGTHTLQRDTILMGKKEEEDEDTMSSTEFFNTNYDAEQGSTYEYETNNNEDYLYNKELTQDIYNILDEKTEIDFLVNRRKPNKQIFNEYYEMCISDLDFKFTKSEIFVELSYYFTDNIFNMFKLLNKKNASGIILELKEKGHLNEIEKINFI